MNFWDIAILLTVGLAAGFALGRMRTTRRCAGCSCCKGSCPAAGHPAAELSSCPSRAPGASGETEPARSGGSS